MLLFIISFGGAITLCISFIKTCRSFFGKTILEYFVDYYFIFGIRSIAVFIIELRPDG